MSFDEQPDGDIHGECAAEIHRLELALLGKDDTVKDISGRLRAAENIIGRPARQIDRSTLDQWKTAAQNFEYEWLACSDFANRRIGALKSQLDACRPYLKEGETAADALIRMQKEVTTLRNAAMQLWVDRSAYGKEDAANEVEEKHGDGTNGLDEHPVRDSTWELHYHHAHSSKHVVRVLAHCEHCARRRFERKNTGCVVTAVNQVADETR